MANVALEIGGMSQVSRSVAELVCLVCEEGQGQTTSKQTGSVPRYDMMTKK